MPVRRGVRRTTLIGTSTCHVLVLAPVAHGEVATRLEDEESLAAFRDSELARTIADAYEAVDVRRETYEVLYPLRPERGPFVSG